ncbi:hypothetical protein MVEN_01562800 [Mycena venus]|uniref:Uncharacterized protein n=1 Tax=Mycena venus TaxID=2733690 RepID=A0A8H7CRD8_9AGAR|nr:hypothetical protein MVEN_01562800 [Mycena venus]
MFSWLFSTWSSPVAQISSASTDILEDSLEHPALTCLRDLVVGGGGAWPPRASYRDSWPAALKPYDSVWRAMEPSFPVKESSTDNSYNRKLIDSFRSRMRSHLEHHVNMGDVQSALERAESYPRVLFTGGLARILAPASNFRRWGVTPIVSEAQNEESVDFPPQIEMPWSFLQRHFGTTSPGGCMTSLMYANMRADDRLEYSVTVGMSESHKSTEYWNTKLLVGMEERTIPMYHLFARAIAFFEAGDMVAACDAAQIRQ